jgi:hypothetical protein
MLEDSAPSKPDTSGAALAEYDVIVIAAPSAAAMHDALKIWDMLTLSEY